MLAYGSTEQSTVSSFMFEFFKLHKVKIKDLLLAKFI